MSAECCVVYVGHRYDIEPHEIDVLEERRDNRQAAAKAVGLKSYWGNFAAPAERYFLFVGTEISILGPENSARCSFDLEELQAVFATTQEKLRQATLAGVPKLHIEWQRDA